VSILNAAGYNYSKADACDVINFEEYEDVARKILEKRPTRAITIFIDMKDVEKSIRVRSAHEFPCVAPAKSSGI
jgi:hypothetical protein